MRETRRGQSTDGRIEALVWLRLVYDVGPCFIYMEGAASVP